MCSAASGGQPTTQTDSEIYKVRKFRTFKGHFFFTKWQMFPLMKMYFVSKLERKLMKVGLDDSKALWPLQATA